MVHDHDQKHPQQILEAHFFRNTKANYTWSLPLGCSQSVMYLGQMVPSAGQHLGGESFANPFQYHPSLLIPSGCGREELLGQGMTVLPYLLPMMPGAIMGWDSGPSVCISHHT